MSSRECTDMAKTLAITLKHSDHAVANNLHDFYAEIVSELALFCASANPRMFDRGEFLRLAGVEAKVKQ